jgi:bifunctional non-homologous end joining protein LigD
MNQEQDITLYYRQGTSDKVYQIQLKREEKDSDNAGWVVNFQYGRRGRSLVGGTKTPRPRRYFSARIMYQDLIRSKQRKGYTEGEGGIPYTDLPDTSPLEKTTYLPQLLNQVNETELHALWGTVPIHMQIKWDGERRGVIYSPNEVIPCNRKGLKTQIQQPIMDNIHKFLGARRWNGIFDTEDMGDHLVVFDMLIGNSLNKRFSERAEDLKELQLKIHTLGVEHLIVDVPFIPETKGEFLAFVHDAEIANEEGIVIRDGNGIYTPGKPASGGPCWKYKFREDATFRVDSIHPTKRSIGLSLFSQTQWVHVGNCTIPANKDIPSIGALIDLSYLYAYPNGSVYQPVYKGERTDLDDTSAVLTQLKYKKETT